NSRRFALTAISYLGTVTARVLPALLVGCQDIAIVQRNAIAATSRFKEIEGDLLTPLIAKLKEMFWDDQASTATIYGLIHLLTALATSTARDTSTQYVSIIETLAALLKHPNSQRMVRVYNEGDSLEDKGCLADALYTALLQIIEGSL